MYITALYKNISENIKQNPHQVFVGICVFFIAVMGTAVQHVASGAFGLLFLASLLVVNKWRLIWKSLTKEEKWLLIGFASYTGSAVMAYVNVQDVDEYIRIFERYFRFLLLIPMYLYVRHHKVNAINYLYAGAIVSGPFLLLIALNSYFGSPGVPARGHYHHIIFGSVAMLNVGVMLTMLMTMRVRFVLKTLLIFCMLCGLATVALSQARGVWLVLPVYFLIAVYYTLKFSKPKLLIAIAVGALISGAGLSIFQGEMVDQRVTRAVDEVRSYYSDNKYKSSLGTRLAMWGIAIDVWADSPIVGTGPGDFDEEVVALQKQGAYKGMEVFTSTHNIYFQALVNAGAIGLIAMIVALFYLPYRLASFCKENKQPQYFLSLTVLLTFATIGIGESWTLRLSIISVYIAYTLAIYSSLYLSEKNSG